MVPFDPEASGIQSHGTPFPCVVVDGAFDAHALDAVLEEWPSADDGGWRRYRAALEYEKFEGGDANFWSPAARDVLTTMMSAEFCSWLGDQLALGDLVADTWGGGYHEIATCGYLAPHADFTLHPVDGRWRRANALLYLVRDYRPDWGGQLILGEPGTTGARAIDPVFGRLVVFATSATSWHGHPDPWRGPTPRRSMAVYYYQPGEWLPQNAERHGTRWLADEEHRLALLAAQRDVESLQQEATQLRAECQRVAREADAWQSAARAAQDAERALRSSTSWRMTAPLRWAKDRLARS